MQWRKRASSGKVAWKGTSPTDVRVTQITQVRTHLARLRAERVPYTSVSDAWRKNEDLSYVRNGIPPPLVEQSRDHGINSGHSILRNLNGILQASRFRAEESNERSRVSQAGI